MQILRNEISISESDHTHTSIHEHTNLNALCLSLPEIVARKMRGFIERLSQRGLENRSLWTLCSMEHNPCIVESPLIPQL